MTIINKFSKKYIVNTVFSSIVFVVASVFFLFFFKQASGLSYGSYYSRLKAGEIADYDVYVRETINLYDDEQTENARDLAYVSVLPVFSMDNKKTLEILSRFDEFRQALASGNFSKAEEIAGSELVSAIVESGFFTDVGIAYEICNDILLRGYFRYSELDNVRNQGYKAVTLSNDYQETSSQIYERQLSIDDDIPTEANLYHYICDKIASISSISSVNADIIMDIVTEFCTPNVYFDSLLTMQRRKNAYNSVDRIYSTLNQGDLVVKKNTVITEAQLYILKKLSKQSRYGVVECLSDIFFVSFAVLSSYFLLLWFASDNGHYIQLIWIITFSAVLSFIFCYEVKVLIDSYLNPGFFLFTIFPVFIVPYVATILSGKRVIGLICSVLMSFIFTRIPIVSMEEFVVLSEMSILSVICMRHFSRRINIIFHFILTLGFSSVIILFDLLLSRRLLSECFAYIEETAVNLCFTYLVFSIIIPVAEKIFNFPTQYRLYELSYSESGVLSRLSQVAPGSFEHSQAVADIAEAAADAIGANGLLCRAGAVYHDIGKMEHPDYFIENQNGINKHDELNPKLSASIIRNHVRVGEEKGRSAGLPEEVIEIIAHHHGTDVIQFFFHEAVKESNVDKEEIQQNDFRYDGEIPQTKECAIVMIADSFEAASRTVVPNAPRFVKLANTIVLSKINNGQMEKSGLTMEDFEIIKTVMVKVVLSKNHHRIQYPNQEESR